MNANTRKVVAANFEDLVKAADALNVPVTKVAAERVVKRLKARTKPLSVKELHIIAKEVGSRLQDEISATKLYCLPKGADHFYSPPQPLFGRTVETRIAEANDDISEAGKCFAVGRYTASVFHLMRAMECSVQRMAEELEIENLDRVWGNLLSDIGKTIEAMSRGEVRDSWSATHSLLWHVKQAWRNKTMHPKATYTEEEAREVLEAVKAFMRHLAGLLPSTFDELISE